MGNITYFKNNPFSDNASQELIKEGIISEYYGQMRGVKGISKKPKFTNWVGMGWGSLEVQLTNEGLSKVKSLKNNGDLTISFE